MKYQVIVLFLNRKFHDWRVLKKSKTRAYYGIKVMPDTEYQETQKLHSEFKFANKKKLELPLIW